MIYLKLFYNFIIVGLFSFGGAYSAIPLVKDVGEKFDVITKDMLLDFIAISESTPGSVGVNLATFVGTAVAGIPGAIIATFAEVLPAFVIILIFTLFLKDALKNKNVKFVLSVIRPCIIGIIMSVGLFMFFENIGLISLLHGNKYEFSNIKSIIIAVIILISMFIYKKMFKKSISGIKTIILGAILGIAINYIL